MITQADLQKFKVDLKEELIRDLRIELRKDFEKIFVTKDEFHATITDVLELIGDFRGEFKQELASFKEEIKEELSEFKSEFRNFKADVLELAANHERRLNKLETKKLS